ncbi:MAG TPA: hypothetical protein VK574_10905 [Terracidiphilus sp.]|nr:hypothetical protein [Terracidiphilus sp.]
MNEKPIWPAVTESIDRRSFCAVTGVAALATLVLPSATAATASAGENPTSGKIQTGNGKWSYEVASGWGHLPAGLTYGGTHGAIATDNAGQVYVSTQSETGILIYSPEGVLKNNIAPEYPEVHSIFHAQEGADEYLYTTVQKGTPKENWLFVKMKTDGTVVQKITAPPQAGFKTPNEWRLTAAVPGPDGNIFIANGYGDSRIFRFDKKGEYRGEWGGKGTGNGLFDCCHGLAVDTRYDQPLLLVCDRENRRLCHLDFDGKFVGTVTQHLRRPCQVSFHGDFAVVSELEGRVTILDKDNAPVAFLGDNPHKTQWANYQLQPNEIAPALFSAAHGCHIDRDANVYVSDWNQIGRVTKLIRINA